MAYGFKDNKCKTLVYAQDDFAFIHMEEPGGKYSWHIMYPDGYTDENIEIISVNMYRWEESQTYARLLNPIAVRENGIKIGVNFCEVLAPQDVYVHEISMIIRKKVD